MKRIFKAIGGVVGGLATGKLFLDQINDLSKEYKKYNDHLEQSIIEFRKKYDDLQSLCDRLTLQTSEAILQRSISETLPIPTTTALKECRDRTEKLKMWNTMFTNTIARILCVSYAEALTFLSSRIQINVLYAKAYCPDKRRIPSKNDESGDDDDEEEEDENDKTFGEYMKTFDELRRSEYVLTRGFRFLSVIAANAAATTIKSEGFTLEKKIDYEVMFQSLLFKSFEMMNGLIYEKMPLVISPLNVLNADMKMSPEVKSLYEFTSRIAICNDFFFILKACASVHLMHVYQTACHIFEGKGDGGVTEMTLKPVATILPHLLKISDSTMEKSTMAGLSQAMGSIELIDAFMFDIYRGILTI